MSKPILAVRDLRKEYGKTVALAGVSLDIQEGELFGLLGPNGAGKTTFLSLIAGLQAPTAGEVYFQGRRLEPADREARRQLGIVPQELAVYGDLTAEENLLFFGQLYGLRGDDLHRRVAEVLEWVGLRERARQRVRTFSGGMQRRLNLALGLVHAPRLLLLDEPTTGVDPQSRNHIFDQVRRLNAAGLTIVYTSHYMEEVQALCPRVGILDHGRLIACDFLAALLRQLEGCIRLRLRQPAPVLRQRLAQLAPLRVQERDAQTIELWGHDVAAALPQLIAALQEQAADLLALELEEPNLEHVFLHLTGRALRD
jgi:ABC-2 type transport system ATP-binding protein